MVSMEKPSPSFREPEYGAEGPNDVTNAGATVHTVVTDTEKPIQPPGVETGDAENELHVDSKSQASSSHSKEENASNKLQASEAR